MTRALILAARPKTLPAAVVPVWTGCVLAWGLNDVLNWPLAIATLLGALFIQIATNFFNDAIDARKGADTEKRLGPERVTASGLMSSKAVMQLGLLFLLLAIACGVVLTLECGWPIIAIGIPCLSITNRII